MRLLRSGGIVAVAPIALLVLVAVVDGFGRPRNHRKYHRNNNDDDKSSAAAAWKSISGMKHYDCTRTSVGAVSMKSTNVDVDYDPHYYECNLLVEFGVVQKIPYEGSSAGDDDPDAAAADNKLLPLDVDFSTACLRCGTCLAVARKINESLMEVHDAAASSIIDDPLQWLENDQVDLVLEAVCNEQFRRYALRETVDGKRYIGDSLPGAMLVPTSADGHWESNLRNKCRDMVKRAGGSRELYKHWRDWCERKRCRRGSSLAGRAMNLADFVCRSNETAGLGDCRSIDDARGAVDGTSQPENHDCQHFYSADIELVAQLGSNIL